MLSRFFLHIFFQKLANLNKCGLLEQMFSTAHFMKCDFLKHANNWSAMLFYGELREATNVMQNSNQFIEIILHHLTYIDFDTRLHGMRSCTIELPDI